MDNSSGWGNGDWNKKVEIDSFIHHFADWTYDWLDVPSMLRGAKEAFEYPMIDRDPVPTWVSGRVALLGDAAHVMYPTGSNGASQAIVDARVLGAAMLEHGVTAEALRAYDAELCAPVSAVVLRNRGAGPFGLLNLLDERCGGVFDDIDDVIPAAEREAFMSRYKSRGRFRDGEAQRCSADHRARRAHALRPRAPIRSPVDDDEQPFTLDFCRRQPSSQLPMPKKKHQ